MTVNVEMWYNGLYGGQCMREIYREAQKRIGYGDILLVREGDRAVVKVVVNGEEIPVISEHLESNFSHCVSPFGIEEAITRNAQSKPIRQPDVTFADHGPKVQITETGPD